MKRKSILLVAVVLFLCACPAFGIISFSDGQTHDIFLQIYDYVYVDYHAPGMYTTVNWLTGGKLLSPHSLYGYENSKINVRGGYIWSLNGYDSSVVKISGGSTNFLSCGGSSRVNISGGSIGSVSSYGSSQVGIFGGSIDFTLSSGGSSRVNISKGSIGKLTSSDSSLTVISGGSINDYLWISGSSQVDISGGSMGKITSLGSSQVNISGGLIGGELISSIQSLIRIFGSDFAVDGQPFGFGELASIYGGSPSNEPYRHLTGTLLSGDFIDNDFQIGYDAKIVLVPEPATLLLLGLGGILIRKRRREF